MEVQLEGQLVGVGVGVEEGVVFVMEDWFVHVPLALQIQRNDLHMNRLSSIKKTEQSQIMYRVHVLQFICSDSKHLIYDLTKKSIPYLRPDP